LGRIIVGCATRTMVHTAHPAQFTLLLSVEYFKLQKLVCKLLIILNKYYGNVIFIQYNQVVGLSRYAEKSISVHITFVHHELPPAS
jgi:hypothetical protein